MLGDKDDSLTSKLLKFLAGDGADAEITFSRTDNSVALKASQKGSVIAMPICDLVDGVFDSALTATQFDHAIEALSKHIATRTQ